MESVVQAWTNTCVSGIQAGLFTGSHTLGLGLLQPGGAAEREGQGIDGSDIRGRSIYYIPTLQVTSNLVWIRNIFMLDG